jgi:hypothetical protein
MVLRFSGYSGQAGRVIDMIDSLVVTNKLLIECTDEGRAGRLAAEKDLRNRAFLAELDTLRRSIIQKGDTASSASDAAVFEKETGEWILANCSMRGLKPGVLYLKNIIAKYYGIKPEVLDACIKAVWPEDLPERYLIHTLWLLARNTKSYKQWAFVRDFIKAMASAAERLAETIMTVSEENGFDINLDRANVLAIEHLIKLGDDYEAKNVPVVARHWHFSDYDAVRVILGGIPKRILFQGYSDREREAIDRLGLELAIGLVLPSARLLPDPIRESFLVYVADSQNKVKKDMEGLRNIVSRRMRVYKELLSAADEAIARKKMSDDEKLALRKEAEALIANLTSKQIRVDAIKRRVVEMVRKSRVKKA